MHVAALVILVLAVGSLNAADQARTVPDPYGLGERLALIDYLHDHRVEMPGDATIEELRAAYEKYIGAPAPVVATEKDPKAAAREEDQRFAYRAKLIRDYGVQIPETATMAELTSLEASRSAATTAAVQAAPPDVPDPFGLGERLALLDYLHEHQVPCGDSDDIIALHGLYRAALVKAPTFADALELDNAHRQARTLGLEERAGEGLAELRLRILEASRKKVLSQLADYGLSTSGSESLDQLNDLLKQAQLDDIKKKDTSGSPEGKKSPARSPERAGTDRGNRSSPASTSSNDHGTGESKTKSTAGSASPEIPPATMEFADRWENYASVSISSKWGYHSYLYVLKGDQNNYYLVCEANDKPERTPQEIEISAGGKTWKMPFTFDAPRSKPRRIPAHDFCLNPNIILR